MRLLLMSVCVLCQVEDSQNKAAALNEMELMVKQIEVVS